MVAACAVPLHHSGTAKCCYCASAAVLTTMFLQALVFRVHSLWLYDPVRHIGASALEQLADYSSSEAVAMLFSSTLPRAPVLSARAAG